jgi:uncharacterized protein (TIGR00375 family)
MEIFADLHLHSKYSAATSKNMDLSNIIKFSKLKGLNLVGTGDFTHPSWLKQIKENLEGKEILYKDGIHFLLTTEVNLVYEDKKVHLLLFSPSLQHTDQIIDVLSKKTNLEKDARPTININLIEFLDLIFSIDKKILVIPAHCMTPWYGIFGSRSGFNSLKEAFGERAKFIYAVESGLSASPDMLWRIREIRDINIVSFSDSHSYNLYRIGREATVFELEEMSYDGIYKAIKEKEGKNRIKYTIEVDPAYGKYHWDGHRNCNIKLSPEESKKVNGICPKCHRKLTIGVEHRVEEISDKPKGFRPVNAKPFFKLLPLSELIANFYKLNIDSKKVSQTTSKLIQKFGSEFNVLLYAPFKELKKVVKEKLAELIIKNREGRIKVDPGYDGVYGKPILSEQKTLLF